MWTFRLILCNAGCLEALVIVPIGTRQLILFLEYILPEKHVKKRDFGPFRTVIRTPACESNT
jgi:hypothetical protein